MNIGFALTILFIFTLSLAGNAYNRVVTQQVSIGTNFTVIGYNFSVSDIDPAGAIFLSIKGKNESYNDVVSLGQHKKFGDDLKVALISINYEEPEWVGETKKPTAKIDIYKRVEPDIVAEVKYNTTPENGTQYINITLKETKGSDAYFLRLELEYPYKIYNRSYTVFENFTGKEEEIVRYKVDVPYFNRTKVVVFKVRLKWENFKGKSFQKESSYSFKTGKELKVKFHKKISDVDFSLSVTNRVAYSPGEILYPFKDGILSVNVINNGNRTANVTLYVFPDGLDIRTENRTQFEIKEKETKNIYYILRGNKAGIYKVRVTAVVRDFYRDYMVEKVKDIKVWGPRVNITVTPEKKKVKRWKSFNITVEVKNTGEDEAKRVIINAPKFANFEIVNCYVEEGFNLRSGEKRAFKYELVPKVPDFASGESFQLIYYDRYGMQYEVNSNRFNVTVEKEKPLVIRRLTPIFLPYEPGSGKRKIMIRVEIVNPEMVNVSNIKIYDIYPEHKARATDPVEGGEVKENTTVIITYNITVNTSETYRLGPLFLTYTDNYGNKYYQLVNTTGIVFKERPGKRNYSKPTPAIVLKTSDERGIYRTVTHRLPESEKKKEGPSLPKAGYMPVMHRKYSSTLLDFATIIVLPISILIVYFGIMRKY